MEPRPRIRAWGFALSGGVGWEGFDVDEGVVGVEVDVV